MRRPNSLRRLIGAVGRLSDCFRTDSVLLVRAFMWRIALPPLKYLIPLPTLVRLMSANPPADGPGTSKRCGSRTESVLHLLEAGGRIVVSSNCLDRSLLVYRFLSEVGARPQLVMGVSKGSTGVAGHAWVEIEGQALADTTTGGFAPILRFGARGRPRSTAG